MERKDCQSDGDGRSDWPTVGTQRNMPRYRQPTHAPQPGVRWRRWLAARCEAEAAARGRAAPALVIARLLHLHLPPRHPGAVDLSDLDTSGDRVGTQDTGCTHGVTGHPGAVDMSGMHGQRRWTRRLRRWLPPRAPVALALLALVRGLGPPPGVPSRPEPPGAPPRGGAAAERGHCQGAHPGRGRRGESA